MTCVGRASGPVTERLDMAGGLAGQAGCTAMKYGDPAAAGGCGDYLYSKGVIHIPILSNSTQSL